jgi:hypothetical protein
MDTLTRPAGRLLAIVAIVAAAAALGGALFVVSGIGHAAPAEGGYPVTIAPGITPSLTSEQVAGISRGYLDTQTPQLAAPALHRPPLVLAEWATRARDAGVHEPRVPPAAVAQQPDRVVWVVLVSGDLLNLGDFPWSRSGAPDPEGTIVIDDASGTILGVYPHDPPGFDSPEPTGP